MCESPEIVDIINSINKDQFEEIGEVYPIKTSPIKS